MPFVVRQNNPKGKLRLFRFYSHRLTLFQVKDRKDKTEGLPGQMILNVLRPPYVSQPLLACVINNELKVYDEHGHELHIFGFKTSFLLGTIA